MKGKESKRCSKELFATSLTQSDYGFYLRTSFDGDIQKVCMYVNSIDGSAEASWERTNFSLSFDIRFIGKNFDVENEEKIAFSTLILFKSRSNDSVTFNIHLKSKANGN